MSDNNICECGLPIHPARHITDLDGATLGTTCGAHLHPAWADECLDRCVARRKVETERLRSQLAAVTSERDAAEQILADLWALQEQDEPDFGGMAQVARRHAEWARANLDRVRGKTNEPPGNTCPRCGGDGVQLTEQSLYGEGRCGTCRGTGRVDVVGR